MLQCTGEDNADIMAPYAPHIPLSQDPLVVKGDTCARTANELLKAFRRLGPKAHDINIPVYIGHGEIH